MKHRHYQQGFSLVELLIVVSLIGLLAVISRPAIEQFIARSRIDGYTQVAGSVLRRARLEAIKRSQPAIFRVNTVSGEGVAFIDENLNDAYDGGEYVLGVLTMPKLLYYAAPAPELIVDGFDVSGDDAWVTFLSNGSVEEAGALRFMDGRGNAMELRVAPAATAKIRVRKWDDSLPVAEDGSHWYGDGEGGQPWTWQ